MSDGDPGQVPEQVWELMRAHLGYSDEELELFRDDPRNARVLRTAPDMRQKTIVFEVVESRGCNSGHVAGTRFFYTGDGNLVTKMAPPRVCAYILPVMTQAIFAMQELWYAGVEPNSMCFRRAGCFDVGVQCGGWGHVIVEARLMAREEARRLWQEGLALRSPDEP